MGEWMGLVKDAAVVIGLILFALLCYHAVVSSQRFWNSSPSDWFRWRRKKPTGK